MPLERRKTSDKRAPCARSAKKHFEKEGQAPTKRPSCGKGQRGPRGLVKAYSSLAMLVALLLRLRTPSSLALVLHIVSKAGCIESCIQPAHRRQREVPPALLSCASVISGAQWVRFWVLSLLLGYMFAYPILLFVSFDSLGLFHLL